MLSHKNPQNTKAILLMAGTGERFGGDTPKQFHRLAGKKVYLHTLEAFLQTRLFQEIFLVCSPLWIEEVKEDLKPYASSSISIVAGGVCRQASSFQGLLACGKQTQIVVIHDAVRPFVSQEILKENVRAALQYGAVDTCIPSADTLVYAPLHDSIQKIPLRSDYLRGQTPQSFEYSLILNAHLEAEKNGLKDCSDDCALVLNREHPVHIVKGSEQNIKITSELDLFLAEQILRLRHTPASALDVKTSLVGKKIAITGGTGGIGSALCRLLKEEGALPIVLSRSAADYPTDLTSYESTSCSFDKIFKEHGLLDGLINSVGFLKTAPLEELSSSEIDQHIATNLTGVIYSCQCAHLQKGAHIVNIASSSYARGRKNYTVYASAKAALVNFTQGLAEERPELYVNAVVPQRTHTAMRLNNFPDENPLLLLEPGEVAKQILLLLQQNSLTGTLIEVRHKLTRPNFLVHG